MTIRVRRERSGFQSVCVCQQPLYPVATWRNGDLVSVVRKHWRRDGCHLPPEPVDPNVYLGRS